MIFLLLFLTEKQSNARKSLPCRISEREYLAYLFLVKRQWWQQSLCISAFHNWQRSNRRKKQLEVLC